MTVLEYIYNWVSTQIIGLTPIVGFETYQRVLIPLLTTVFFVATIYILWYLVGWVIRFVSSQFPW